VGIVARPLVGPWIDGLGRRPFMLVRGGLALLAALLAMAGSTVVMLGLVRALQRIAFSLFFVASFAYVLLIGFLVSLRLPGP
jgi:hypothetical protein